MKPSSAPLYDYDIICRYGLGISSLAGIDEVGRGPLAGPVVIAGVILPPDSRELFPVYDSKALSEEERNDLAQRILSHPLTRYAIAERSAEVIDKINILRATHEGMREVAQKLNAQLTLVDGNPVPSFPVPVRFLVKGDATSACIAAASILAKSYRDHLMVEAEQRYPGYGFAQHKGYGTAEHLEALKRQGPCPLHRRTFAPVRDLLFPSPQQLDLGF